MENTDIPQFHTYRGEIEFEGTLMVRILISFHLNSSFNDFEI